MGGLSHFRQLPELQLEHWDLERRLSRLETLQAFLESKEVSKVEVVFSLQAREGSLTLVGDWFLAESLAPRPGGYLQTVFNWHAPTVTRRVRFFDEQFDDLCWQRGWVLSETRVRALDELGKIMDRLKSDEGDSDDDGPASTAGVKG